MEGEDSQNEKEKLNEKSKKKEPIIIFSKLNKYFFFPFLIPITTFGSNYFCSEILRSGAVKKVEFFIVIYIELALIIGGLLQFIPCLKYNMNKGKESSIKLENNKNSIEYIYNQGITINTKKLMLFMVLLSLIFVFYELISSIFIYNKMIETNLYFLYFIPLFNKFILKENIYKHHILSLISSSLGTILVLIPMCMPITNDDIVPNILNLISGVLFSLYSTLIKYVIEEYYLSPFKISFLMGLISIVVSCFGFVIYSLIKYHDFSYFNDIFDFSEVENKIQIGLCFIPFFIFLTILEELTFITLFYFSPILIGLTNMMTPVLLWIKIKIEDGYETIDLIMTPIGYLIILFSSIIYNELIILNFCGLGKNTKKIINRRITKEIIELNEIKDEIENDDDSDDENEEKEEKKII